MEKKQAVVGDYVVTARIGSGSFAIVYKGYHKVTNVPVAVKAINKTKLNPKLLENLESEISIMRQINHPNIVKLYDIKKTDKHIYLMLEYCDGGDLQHFIKKQPNGVVTEATARHFLRELADGLHVLWSLNLIHRDLKPQNLLLTEPSATSSLKIADFGFARHLESTSLAETLCGSPLYMAPEILQFQKYDNKADLWSVGTILYEMVLPYPKRRISFDQFFHAPFLDRPPPSSAMLLSATLVRTNPVDIAPISRTNPPPPPHSKLHESYRASMMQSYRRRSASSTSSSSSILKTSVPVPPPLLLPSPSSQLPVSPDLVPISMSSLRINPFKTDLAASTSSAMLTSTSAPATGGHRYMSRGLSPPSTPPSSTFITTPTLPLSSSPPHPIPASPLIHAVPPNAAADPMAPTARGRPMVVAGLELTMQVSDMVERVQAILSIVDVIMQRSRAAADACGGLVHHPSGTSSVSSSANSSPASSVVGPDNGRVATRHHLVPSCPEHALMLVMKALRMLHMVADGQISANNQGRIKAVLIQCIDKAEQCTSDERSGVEGGGGKASTTTSTTSLSFDEILYAQVVRLGREAAVHEVLGQKGLAGDLYGRALLLLESVLIASASTLHPDDRLRLVQFWHAFRQRLGQCRDDDVAVCPSDTNDQST
ncbi:hypothetical protein B5M09_008031 [Aphanomyces astaci]|uniref:Protein kinase domain-containing protein n=1 Tax=Aphanomyces astaci TaxID=112090 RepID=A0A3R7Y0M6_APHAT|nr:hypothetical protein B5M09_008031 [Aphanomyces astaci]